MINHTLPVEVGGYNKFNELNKYETIFNLDNYIVEIDTH